MVGEIKNVDEKNKLKSNAVGTIQGIFQSLSYVGPAADVAILLLGTVAFALVATPLAIIVAWLSYGIFMVMPYEFSKYKANAGSYYAYAAGSTSGGGFGPMALFTWMGENFTGQAFGILGLSAFIFAISTYISNIPYLWILFAVIITLYMFILPYLGIKVSTNYMAITGMLEVLLLVIGSFIIIARLGSQNTLKPFYLPAGGAIGSFFFGVIFSIVDFTGLGTVTTISEEMKDSKRNVRKSILIAWLLAGLALIPASYALVVGWGIHSISGFATAPDPGLIVFYRYLGPVGFILLIIFTTNSYFSYSVSKTNAVSRIWYSAARDKVIFPEYIGKIHKKYKTPGNAMLVWLAISFMLDVITGIYFGPVNAALILLTMTGICIVTVHIIGNTSLTFFSHTVLKKTGESSILYHYIVPTIASFVGLVIIYYTVLTNIQTYLSDPTSLNLAYLIVVIFAVLWILIGAVAVTLYYKFRKPNVLNNAGNYDAEMDIEENS
jgi:amino acid transporter